MIRSKIASLCLFALFLVPLLAAGKDVDLPPMHGMRSTRGKPLSEVLEKSKLCDMAKFGLEMAASMEGDNGSKYKAYKTSKSVAEVLEYYAKLAAKSGMGDASPTMWDNSKGKKDENQPKDCSGTLVFSMDYAKERVSVTIAAFREAKSSNTTVYVFLPKTEKKTK
ncbi:MAG: hypothetical protein GXP25_21020 [Planctomycetes bacterium]|nr:hypothetical protein [Planctomycetota bacterium]